MGLPRTRLTTPRSHARSGAAYRCRKPGAGVEYGANAAPIPRGGLASLKRPEINLTPIERIGRMVIGAVGAIGGLVLLGSVGGVLARRAGDPAGARRP